MVHTIMSRKEMNLGADENLDQLENHQFSIQDSPETTLTVEGLEENHRCTVQGLAEKLLCTVQGLAEKLLCTLQGLAENLLCTLQGLAENLLCTLQAIAKNFLCSTQGQVQNSLRTTQGQVENLEGPLENVQRMLKETLEIHPRNIPRGPPEIPPC